MIIFQGILDYKMKVKCLLCKKEFNTVASRLLVGRGKYCSKKCSNVGVSNKLKGKVGYWTGKKFSEEHKKKLGRKGGNSGSFRKGSIPYTTGKKLDESIRKRISMTLRNLTEEEWTGFADRNERARIMQGGEYINWRKHILKRDDYTCQICGTKGGELRANHIKRFADFPELRFTVTNGITICKACDCKWILNREKQWESYFNFNLMVRGCLNGW